MGLIRYFLWTKCTCYISIYQILKSEKYIFLSLTLLPIHRCIVHGSSSLTLILLTELQNFCSCHTTHYLILNSKSSTSHLFPIRFSHSHPSRFKIGAIKHSGLFAWTYQPAYQLESTVFFSYNKTALAGFNTSRTGPSLMLCHSSLDLITQARLWRVCGREAHSSPFLDS